MVDEEIKLIKADVTAEPIEVDLCECEEDLVSHWVFVDYRSAGMRVAIGRYCKTCAAETVAVIQDGLPE